MKNRFRHLTITQKIAAAMTVVILLYAFIFCTISIINSKTELNRQILTSQQEVLNQYNYFINTQLENMMSLTSSVYLEKELIQVLGNANGFGSSGTELANTILNRMILFDNSISFAAILSPYFLEEMPYVTTDNSFGMPSYEQLAESFYLKDFVKQGLDMNCYFLPEEDDSFLKNNSHDKIIYIRTIRNTNSAFQIIGYFVLGINTDYFDALSENMIDSNAEALAVFDASGNLLYEYGSRPVSDWQELVFENTFSQIGKTPYCVLHTNENALNWQIIYSRDLSGLSSRFALYTLGSIILAGCIMVLMFFVIAILITKVITAPLVRLLHSMQQFQEGDFQQKLPVKSYDEIGQLTSHYNQMVVQIKELIQQNYVIKLHEKETELAALQTQINPHFLYNTLDLLYWKALSGNDIEVSNSILALSRLFRLSLHKNQSFITLRKEQEFLNAYLSLQKSLMSDKLTYSIIIEESLLDTYLPRFVIQPIVENSIVHGLEEQLINPVLSVSIVRQDESMRITVTDNGIGMDKDALQQLNAPYPSNIGEQSGGYAIINVRSRLYLYFSDYHSFQVASVPKKGTTVTLVIPITTVPLA